MKHDGKTNVLHLTFDMAIGGTEQVIKNIILGMDDARFGHSVLCIDGKIGAFGEDLIEKGINVTSLSRERGFDLNLVRDLRQHIKNNKIHVLHCHQYTPWVYGCLAAFCLSTKVVFTEHGRFYPDSSSIKRRLVNPLLVNLTNKITAISAATKQALVDYEYISDRKILVVYNGISDASKDMYDLDSLRNELKIEKEAIVLGTVARLDPIKNQRLMLHAFKGVTEKVSNLYLLIVGDGPEKKQLEALSKELGIEKQVIFTGYKPKPYIYLKLIDLYLLSSLSEGTSMTLLEAMSFAKACVVTDAGGNAEIICDSVNGKVTPNDKVDKFRDAIVELVSDLSLLRKMGIHARELYEQKFSVLRMNEQYKNIYLNVLGYS